MDCLRSLLRGSCLEASGLLKRYSYMVIAGVPSGPKQKQKGGFKQVSFLLCAWADRKGVPSY